MTSLLFRLLVEEAGTDLVEYALLSGFVAIAGFAAMNAIGAAISSTYVTWDAAQQGLWEPAAPVE